ncbi:MAG: isochorismate synthase, partial [Opitutaceae bacterium]
MEILPLHPAENATSPDALRGFLAQCRDAAERDRHDKLVSISLALPPPDPLAVLELIFDPAQPHFYAERPSIGTALAGAEVAVRKESAGSDRFRELRDWAEETLAHTIAVGDVNAPLGGPHFFTAFGFREEREPGQPFPAASAFVPRWQVALAGG